MTDNTIAVELAILRADYEVACQEREVAYDAYYTAKSAYGKSDLKVSDLWNAINIAAEAAKKEKQ